MATPEPTRRSLPGREAMRDLALSVVSALEDAELEDEILEISRRVFGRSAESLFESQVMSDGTGVYGFKPMVELALREIRSAARAPELSAAERRRRIRWTLDVTGF